MNRTRRQFLALAGVAVAAVAGARWGATAASGAPAAAAGAGMGNGPDARKAVLSFRTRRGRTLELVPSGDDYMLHINDARGSSRFDMVSHHAFHKEADGRYHSHALPFSADAHPAVLAKDLARYDGQLYIL